VEEGWGAAASVVLMGVVPHQPFRASTSFIMLTAASPSGFFVPQLLAGAALGRLFGDWLIDVGAVTPYWGQVRQ